MSARDRAAEAAHARLQQGIDARDVAAISSVLTESVSLVTLTGDTVTGNIAAAGQLVTLPLSAKQLALFDAKREACLTGDVHEYNGELVGVRPTERFASAGYAILWQTDQSTARARSIVLSYDRSALRHALTCVPEYASAARLHRWTVTMAYATRPVASPAASEIESAMRSRGFVYLPAPAINDGPGARPFPRSDHSTVAVQGGLRYRIDQTKSVELQIGVQRAEAVAGFDTLACTPALCGAPQIARGTYVEARTLPITVSTLMQWQSTRWRFGLGPAVLLGNWTVNDDDRYLVWGEDVSKRVSSGWGTTSVQVNSHSSHSLAPAPGAAAELAVMLPMSRELLGELRIGAAAFTNATLPSTARFASVSVPNFALNAGVSLGFGWR